MEAVAVTPIAPVLAPVLAPTLPPAPSTPPTPAPAPSLADAEPAPKPIKTPRVPGKNKRKIQSKRQVKASKKRETDNGHKSKKAKASKPEKRRISEPVKAVVGRKHLCNKCHKAFSDSSSLRKHVKIHGEKTFSCQVEEIGRAVQQECRDRSRMPSSA
eukprot:TRINITY_DN23558_c0_g2_i3.p1 TRINITY_DN23558_c0_g2~~TRINITY_DN23558_c0_g2_i3.p1  ORF type:complete len:158 (+),score=24.17 TRINITY_DN23558_c0_g2_i3:85-558(+)